MRCCTVCRERCTFSFPFRFSDSRNAFTFAFVAGVLGIGVEGHLLLAGEQGGVAFADEDEDEEEDEESAAKDDDDDEEEEHADDSKLDKDAD